MSPCTCGKPAVITWTPPVGADRPDRSSAKKRRLVDRAAQPWWPRLYGHSCLVPHAGPREAPRHLCERCYLAAVKERAARDGVPCHGFYTPTPASRRIGGTPWRRRPTEAQRVAIHRAFGSLDFAA
jgi:hypothetical protein